MVSEIRKNPKKHPLRKSLLKVDLQPHQLDGIAFCYGAGRAILADDMGLGKTVQLIAYLLHIHRTQSVQDPSFIICPTSVLGNWQKELARFAPDLRVHVHYGQLRSKDESFASELAQIKPDVVLMDIGLPDKSRIPP